VIVQASCHGKDNSALKDALITAAGGARGVAVIGEDTPDSELRELNEAGVRGIRFNFLTRLADPRVDEYYQRLTDRVAALGWHIVVYVDETSLESRWRLLTQLPTDVVVDHMGRPDVSRGVDGTGFRRILRLLDEYPGFWIKVSGSERLSETGPPDYRDVVPFGRHLVDAYPDRVLWGTDWPHPNMRSHMPDDGQLVDVVREIAPSEELRRRLLVDNPMRLYWPELEPEGGRNGSPG
jgi:2-pyrone-4,6-dicarboxylate lactonase